MHTISLRTNILSLITNGLGIVNLTSEKRVSKENTAEVLSLSAKYSCQLFVRHHTIQILNDKILNFRRINCCPVYIFLLVTY